MHPAIRALFLFLPLCLRAQSVAFSFDDGFKPSTQPQASKWNAALLDSLAKAKVKAILLPAGKRVDGPEGLALVRAWGEAGHALGNHSYSHASLGARDADLQAFETDVLRNEALLKTLPGWTKRFRFPYLKEGSIAAARDGFRAWMKAQGYRPAPVSIDASDWYYDLRFAKWQEAHPGADPAPFREAYLDHLWSRASYYDGLSKQILGRSARHVILLHTNAINATFIADIIALFKVKGWAIIPPEEAFADPLYAREPDVLPAGESILWSLAKATGMAGLRYPAENDTYEKPILDARGF